MQIGELGEGSQEEHEHKGLPAMSPFTAVLVWDTPLAEPRTGLGLDCFIGTGTPGRSRGGSGGLVPATGTWELAPGGMYGGKKSGHLS